ncbi:MULTISPECIES: SDR family oxidoreductase [unclassified Mesorhizobium]|uniref:SDR family oxidoreductase n=2 Tax=unclassified Mesorhizobium TaxID=325217 RepID=UPI0003CEA10E|nr:MULTISPECIES: SDR family oxidoreductase [unclassified Mesorhizobium]ESW90331.1 oxidoreductase [Mesorhizobium sp. LSJC285A00]ESX27329.1 oxidoreductase [Mesorhizobium sp. LSJC264A00]ESY06406.1 oxidoreductase [Mesorhizobium sp. LNJC399B00]ESY48570.1 oxidoreductase [Mesorhizobium sp. LNJC380A00]ESY56239.1 oxidoreductase [Mesorhizobium sp. LNJC374B00]
MQDAQQKYPRPPLPEQQQDMPGYTDEMDPRPDHGEESYRGSGKLTDRVALITGADSGIGRAVAIAFAREGADVMISYLEEDEDAQETARLVEEAGRKAVLAPGDISDEIFARSLVQRAIDECGRLDILVNNAAHQASFEKLEDISAEEWDLTFRTNVYAMFYLSQEAVKHMEPGSTIINTSSINATSPSPALLAYATTKGAIANFTAGLAGLVAERGIRVNAVAPGPIWTPLIPSTMPSEKVKEFGKNTPLKRPGQPAELAATYVLLASEGSSYTTGALYEVTGGRPML